MSDIRAMVFDLDGTLLNRRCCLSAANEHALRTCLARGILLYVATARPPRRMHCLGDPPGQIAFLAGRGVFYNGALATDETCRHERHWIIPANTTFAAVTDLACIAHDLNVVIQWVDHSHAFRLPVDDHTLAEWAVLRQELRPFDVASRQPCFKIIAWHETQHLRAAHAELQKRYGRSLNIFLTDSGRVLQLMDCRATKEAALLDLLELHSIPPSDVVVFGDGPTDVGMFRTFGHSVAMGNAPLDVQAAARHVTADCDEDGVAKAIHECFGIA